MCLLNFFNRFQNQILYRHQIIYRHNSQTPNVMYFSKIFYKAQNKITIQCWEMMLQ